MNDDTRNDSAHLGVLAAVAAVATYALIVFGGIVRITGSGMGCGDDWPLCNGRLIPPLEFEPLIEFGHRLAALGVSLLVVALAAVSVWAGSTPQRRTIRRLSLLALVLLIAQVLLGAVTVWWELPTGPVFLHFGTAMSLLTVLALAACTGLAGPARPEPKRDGAARTVILLAAFAFGVALLGALVANLEAGPACLGFPACNGSWFPRGGGLVYAHWTHRLAAYLLFLLVLPLPWLVARRRPGDRPAIAWSAVSLVVAAAQIAIGAAMVLAILPAFLRALHLGAGAALVTALVVVAWLVRRPRSIALRGRPAGG